MTNTLSINCHVITMKIDWMMGYIHILGQIFRLTILIDLNDFLPLIIVKYSDINKNIINSRLKRLKM